jgi:SAM-dependent methyltransferase
MTALPLIRLRFSIRMDETKLSREGWIQSADAWIASMEEGDLNRELLLDPVLLEWLEPLPKGLILDIGCGEGRFSRKMTGPGSTVIGLDPVVALAETAHRKGGLFLVGDGEKLPFPSERFDLALSYLVLLDIPDYRAAIREMARVLKPGGHALIANVNPLVSSQDGWCRNEKGDKLHIKVDDYLSERGAHVSWANIAVYNWHRPLQNYLTAFLDVGLILRRYVEPSPSEAAIEQEQWLAGGRRVPWFHVMLWQKPL